MYAKACSHMRITWSFAMSFETSAPVLVIGCHLGMRNGEILGLLWDQAGRLNLIRLHKLSGAPGETRTPGLLVRSQPLYPAELRAHAIGKYT
jgi:hypothetical protein